MKFYHIILAAFVLSFLSACSNIQPLYNIENTPIVYNLKSNQVKSAIIQSGSNRGWIMKEINPGEIRGELFVRGHQAVIDVSYTDKTYSINYVSSNNLKYKDGTIHRNYNRWINNLDFSIKRALAQLSAQ